MNRYDDKDMQRIEGIAQKANGDAAKALQLATNMANKIGDADKASRRGYAAEAENYHDIAAVFFNRAKELGGGNVNGTKEDMMLRKIYPANIEGSEEFNKANAKGVTTLYQKDSKGRVKVWTIEVVAIAIKGEARILSTSGLEGGKMTPDITVITEGKNVGKANETSYYEQALAEAQSKIDKQIRAGYVADRSAVKESSELGSGAPAPMLAMKYDPKGKQSGSKTLEKMGVKGKKGVVQPKIDGHRRTIKLTAEGALQHSRKGDVVVQLPHLSEQLMARAAKIMKELGVSELWLDGEAFTSEVSFSELSGLLRKESGHTEEELEKRSKINLRLYDVMLPVGYEKRKEVIAKFAHDNIIIIESHEIIFTDENIQKLLDQFLAEGHEGLMMRQYGIPYENKRSWQLIKNKIFEDEEMTIIGGEESVKKGMLGNFIVRDKKGIECKPGLKFSHPERKEMWKNLKSYIGKQATVEYFGRSEYGVPRFPRVIQIGRDDI